MNNSKGVNPKDLLGVKKVDMTLVSPIALAHCALAMMDGARKYGPYNWRSNYVQARIYIAAALRHLLAWADGEELAADSQAHHLGHAMACCAILLDAQATGCLADNRHKSRKLAGLLKHLQAVIERNNHKPVNRKSDNAQRETKARRRPTNTRTSQGSSLNGAQHPKKDHRQHPGGGPVHLRQTPGAGLPEDRRS